MNRRAPHTDGSDIGPSYLDSLAGFITPGKDTAREGSAGTTALVVLVVAAVGAVAIGFARRR